MSYASNEHIITNANLVLKINMSAFNPLASILSNNRLDETNYVSWKRNLNIVLTCEGIILGDLRATSCSTHIELNTLRES